MRFKVVLKQREITNPQLGQSVLNRITEMMEDIAQPEKEPKTEGRFVSLLFVPKKQSK